MTEPVRVVVADDHPLIRDGLRAMLEGNPETEFAGEAGTGEAVIELCLEVQPDVVIMDLHMPDGDGISATRSITSQSMAAVLVLTMYDDDASVFAALQAGARGYVLKGGGRDEMLAAVLAVHRGEAIFGAAVAARVLRHLGTPRQGDRTTFPELTDREREVLHLLADGATNGTIARRLSITPKTVRNHVANVLNKLQVSDRAQAALRARDAGFGAQRTPVDPVLGRGPSRPDDFR